MSIEPCRHFNEEINALSGLIEGHEQEVGRYRTLILFVGDQMRKTAAVTAAVARAQHEAISAFVATPRRDRSAYVLEEKLKNAYRALRYKYLNDYRMVLKERKTVIEEGEEMPLTKEKRDLLVQQFEAKLERALEQYEGEILFDHLASDKTWQAVAQKLEERMRVRTGVEEALIQQEQSLTKEQEAFRKALAPKQEEAKKLQLEYLGRMNAHDLHSAAQCGDLAYIETALKTKWFAWTKKNLLMEIDVYGYAPLHYAAYHGQTKVLDLLFEHHVDVMQRDSEGYVAAHWAAKKGQRAALSKLSRQVGFDPNARGAFGRTPLQVAVFQGCQATVLDLLEVYRANVNVRTEDHAKITPLHSAVLNGNEEMVKILTGREELNPNMKDKAGHTAIYYAIQEGLVGIVQAIWDHPKFRRPYSADEIFLVEPTRNQEEVSRILGQFSGVRS